jgi:hypothetical protein
MQAPALSPSQPTADTIIAALQSELQNHTFDFFVDEPPAMGQGGKGIVVPGCPTCKRKLNTVGQFIDHLYSDVIPRAVEAVFSAVPPSSPATWVDPHEVHSPDPKP